jgi:8-oxo-dGTP diphosphatase
VSDENHLHVAVGVIKDANENVLISLRHDSAHQGGLWEFPGGKVEPGESTEQALKRELKEELDIMVDELCPLIKIKHQYPDLNVLLDVWTVTRFFGEAKGCEGQKINWVSVDRLLDYCFPAANIPIIAATRLPSEYAILNAAELPVLLKNLGFMLDNGVKLIQARIRTLSALEVKEFVKLAMPLCQQKGAYLLLNSAVQNINQVKVNGIHLTSRGLLALKQRPAEFSWVGASCHNQKELKHAEAIGADFAVLAPVLPTRTHPDAEPLGWDEFKRLIDGANIPVFALGGMQKKDLKTAQSLGAQGISGITCFLAE